MNKNSLPLIIWSLLCISALSCGRLEETPSKATSYKVNTVQFVMNGEDPVESGPAPNIYIDTNVSISGPAGGKIKSRKPYSIGIDYTDESFSFASIEFTHVSVTYEDGTADPGIENLELPLKISARPYESVNSMEGGRIEKTQLRIISGRIPDIISRDAPLSLHIEGKLIGDDKTSTPFTIRHRYDVIQDDSIRTWSEVIKEI